jgi:hypothetical protein
MLVLLVIKLAGCSSPTVASTAMQQATAKEVGLIQKQRKHHVYIGCIYHTRTLG